MSIIQRVKELDNMIVDLIDPRTMVQSSIEKLKLNIKEYELLSRKRPEILINKAIVIFFNRNEGTGIYDMSTQMLYYILRSDKIEFFSKKIELIQFVKQNDKYLYYDKTDMNTHILQILNSIDKEINAKNDYDIQMYHMIAQMDIDYIKNINDVIDMNKKRDIYSNRSFQFFLLQLHFNIISSHILQYMPLHYGNLIMRHPNANIIYIEKPLIMPRKDISKQAMPDSIGTYYISGHSERHISRAEFDSNTPDDRISIDKNCCFYTLARTTSPLNNDALILFNIGLQNPKNKARLQEISFDSKKTSELKDMLKQLEKEIYTDALFYVYVNKFPHPYREILDDILKYIHHNKKEDRHVTRQDFLNYMDMPIIDIIKFILILCNINEETYDRTDGLMFADLSKYLGDDVNGMNIGFRTLLVEPLNRYLNQTEDRLLFSTKYTYFDLFRTLKELELKRYSGLSQDTITNYNISVRESTNSSLIMGVLDAPYPLEWYSEERGLTQSIGSFTNRHNKLVNTVLSAFGESKISKIYEDFIETINKHEKNIFIITMCNVMSVGGEPLRPDLMRGTTFNFEYNKFKLKTPEIRRARSNSLTHIKMKYLKYKNKYLELKKIT